LVNIHATKLEQGAWWLVLTYVKRHVGAVMEQHYYRKRAMDCLAAAQTVREPGERLCLLHIAQLFLRLAARVRTRLDRGTPHRLPERPTNPIYPEPDTTPGVG
jgi:hypothetical protein